MNWVLALLAFAGLMAILSTIVSVVVEGVHKIFALRSRGLQEMLRAMHDSLDIDPVDTARLTPLEAVEVKGHSKDASRFAKDITFAPAWGGRMRWWWPSRWGLTIFPRRFERLTKRQFAEQLAQTAVGERLADKPREEVKLALARAGYEFDRFGVAQSHFFGRRAKFISGLVAFIFVIFANVNAIQLYIHLAHDNDGLNNTLSLLSSEDGAQNDAIAAYNIESALQTLRARSEAISASAGTGDISNDVAAYADARQDLVSTLQLVRTSTGLPMGHDFFPYCGNITGDDRCGHLGKNREPTADIPKLPLIGWAPDLQPGPLLTLWSSPGETFIWLMSMIATAGLLALGAPFWFDLFNRMAAIAGTAASSRLQQARLAEEQTALRAAPDPMVHGKRGDEEPNIDGLADAFLLAARRRPAGLSGGGGDAPLGRRLGEASQEAARGTRAAAPSGDTTVVAAVHAHTPGQNRPAIRRVRGDWSGTR